MEYLILFIMACAWWSYVWESAFAPTARAGLRWRLFEIRDRLRAARMSDPELPQPVFNELQESINWAVNNLHHLSLWELRRAHAALHGDAELRKKVKARDALLESSGSEEAKGARWQAGRVYFLAMIVNAGGWATYIMPMMVVLSLLKSIKRFMKALLWFPSPTRERIFHNSGTPALS